MAACHAINHLVCDGLFNDVRLLEQSQIYVYGKGDDFISVNSKIVVKRHHFELYYAVILNRRQTKL